MAINKRTPALAFGGRIQRFGAKSIYDAMALIGFDPQQEDSGWMVHFSDSHFWYYGASDSRNNSTLAHPLKAELLSFAAIPPDFITLNGDTLTYYCVAFGQGANPHPYGDAEAAWAQTALEEIAVVAPIRFTLGNHDTQIDEAKPGIYLASVMALFADQYASYYTSALVGGVRVAWPLLNHGGDMLPATYTPWAADVAALASGQEMITYTHQTDFGVVSESGMATAFRAVLDANPSIDNDFWAVSGHSHAYSEGDSYYRSANIYTWTCSSAAWQSVTASGDYTSPALSAILCRDGKVVGRLAWDAKEGFWYLLPDPIRSSSTEIAGRLDGLDDLSITSKNTYLEGSYTRTFDNTKGANWLDCGSFLYNVVDLKAHFVVDAAATGFWLLHQITPSAVSLSANGSDWTAVTLGEATKSIATAAIPVGMRGTSPLYVRVQHGTGTHLGGFGFY